MIGRSAANWIAFLVALAVLAWGITLVVSKGPTFDPPSKTIAVTETGSGAGVGKRTQMTEVSTEPEKATRKETTSVEEPSGVPSGKKTTTVEESEKSLSERVLGESGLILLQLGIVLLAAFLAGAFTQRLLLADFALKLGGLLEIGALQEKAEQTLEGLTAKVAATAEAQAKHQKRLEEIGDRVSDTTSNSVTLGLAVSQLRDRIAKLESERGKQ